MSRYPPSCHQECTDNKTVAILQELKLTFMTRLGEAAAGEAALCRTSSTCGDPTGVPEAEAEAAWAPGLEKKVSSPSFRSSASVSPAS